MFPPCVITVERVFVFIRCCLFKMDQQVKKSSEIEYDKDSVVEHQAKRFKYMQQGLLNNIASSLETIAQSTKSIGESHTEFLKVNKLLTSYLLEIEKKKKEKNLAQAKITTPSIRDQDQVGNNTSDLSK